MKEFPTSEKATEQEVHERAEGSAGTNNAGEFATRTDVEGNGTSENGADTGA